MVYLSNLFPDKKFPIGLSLGIIGAAIGLSIAFSFMFPKKEETKKPLD